MAARDVVSARHRRLGSEVRKIRTTAKVSAEEAARLLNTDRGKISNMESGVRPINVDRIRTLAEHCGCTDEEYVQGLMEMAAVRSKGWWSRYRGTLPPGLLDIAEMEAHARRLRTSNSVHVPGILQTSDYALAVFRVAVPALPEHELGLRMAFRAERQRVITGDEPTETVAVIHEAALRMGFGGSAVAKGQLRYLLEVSELDNVTVLVLPFDCGAFPGAGQTVVFAEGPVPRLDTVQVDSAHGPEFIFSENQVIQYRGLLDWLEDLALSPNASRDLMRGILRQL